MRMGSQRHIPAALPSGKPQGTPGAVGWVGPIADLEGCGKLHGHRDPIHGPSRI
jgi:hypothetical protein